MDRPSLPCLCRQKLAKWRTKMLVASIVFCVTYYAALQVIYRPVIINICPDPSRTPAFYEADSEAHWDNLTIVTMYLNIGSNKDNSINIFKAGHYSVTNYRSWLVPWSKLRNRVVAYFDDDVFLREFKAFRSHLPGSLTTVIKISKSDLPAFRDEEKVKNILKNPSFKTTYPAEYTCTMNAKYDALDMALKAGHVKTKYLAWADIGLFRKLEGNAPVFSLSPPPGFNMSSVSVSEVMPRDKLEGLTPQEIYQQNRVWVAGGFMLSTAPVMEEFINTYRKASAILISLGLADTDQQVLASMYSPHMTGMRPTVQLSTYACPWGAYGLFGHAYMYFCLPYTSMAASKCLVDKGASLVRESRRVSSEVHHTYILGGVIRVSSVDTDKA